jgi:hypothetical protein
MQSPYSGWAHSHKIPLSHWYSIKSFNANRAENAWIKTRLQRLTAKEVHTSPPHIELREIMALLDEADKCSKVDDIWLATSGSIDPFELLLRLPHWGETQFWSDDFGRISDAISSAGSSAWAIRATRQC